MSLASEQRAACSNCQRPSARLIQGRCLACHLYWFHHKSERPPAGVRADRRCKSCGAPTGDPQRVYCPACHKQGGWHKRWHLREPW
jgi:hypothetical protein